MIVVDAGATIDLLLRRPAALMIEEQLHRFGLDLHAPHLLDVEVPNALRRLVAAGESSTARAEQAIGDLLDLRIERYGHDLLMTAAWNLRHAFSPYDAVYLALTQALAEDVVPLLTTDSRLARAAATHGGFNVVLAAG